MGEIVRAGDVCRVTAGGRWVHVGGRGVGAVGWGVVYGVVEQGADVVYEEGVEGGGDVFFVGEFEGALVWDPVSLSV